MWIPAEKLKELNKKIIYEFKITLNYFERKIIRIIEVPSSIDMVDLAYEITRAYNFDFDHLFQFQDYKKRNEKHKEVYIYVCDAFLDACAKHCTPGSNVEEGCNIENGCAFHARGMKISKVFVKDKRLEFWFDFGDDWKFDVKCIGVHEREKDKKRYPRIALKKGRAPKQYPEYD